MAGIPLMDGEIDYMPDATFDPQKILRMGEGVAMPVLGDDAVLDVRFYEKRVPIPSKSTEEAIHFEKRDYCRIQRPGDKSTVWDQPAREADKQRFPYQWQAYRAGKSQDVGTPIERVYELGLLSEPQVLMLKASGVKTVEQASMATEAVVSGWGSDGPTIQKFCKGFIAQREKAAKASDLEELKAELAAEREAREKLEEQIVPKDKPARKRTSKKKEEDPIEEVLEVDE